MKKRFEDWKQPIIEHGKLTKWNWVVQYPEKFEIGQRVDIGAFSYLNSKNGIIIADDVQIGSHCSLYTESSIDNKVGSIKIGKGSCIGSHSTIMPGVIIGEGVIIGAHSFINRDIPDNSKAFGVPVQIK